MPGIISSEDIRLISESRTKEKFADISSAEREAYRRVHDGLLTLGRMLQFKFTESGKGEYALFRTAGFHIDSGVRGRLPKDLWVSITPQDSVTKYARLPQVFLIVSERGVEYGYGPSVSPSDFSQAGVKKAVREVAPFIFQQLPDPQSEQASKIDAAIKESGQWFFRRKHRLAPAQNDFADLHEWLAYLKSPQGQKNAAGAISRYAQGEAIDDIDWDREFTEVARIFAPLMNLELKDNAGPARQEQSVMANQQENFGRETFQFKQALSNFLRIFSVEREKQFSVGADLKTAMNEVIRSLQELPAIAGHDSLSVKMSVGQGSWTKTPWIAVLDSRATTSTQRGIYIVFLIADDLSVTYLTLNQGMTDLVKKFGQAGAVDEMLTVAGKVRVGAVSLIGAEIALDNQIDLKSHTNSAKNYELGTIAHVDFSNDALPSDQEINRYLAALITANDRLIDRGLEATRTSVEAEVAEPETAVREPYSIDNALADLFLDREAIERYLAVWRAKKNLILQGAPGVGKSFIARRLAYVMMGYKDNARIGAVQFHQSYSYEDFVQGYRPNGTQGFERKDGTFFSFCRAAQADSDNTYVFIIDEINRGNLSKIFGELMLLIEPDKRSSEWATRLAYASQNDRDFHVPENVFIIGMMNTADRSLSLVDYALRRRFAFMTMEPLFTSPRFQDHVAHFGVPKELIERLVARMEELNSEIGNDRVNLGPGFRIGHSFFTPTEPVLDPETWYRQVIETEVYPLLEEYWFDAPETADKWREQLLS